MKVGCALGWRENKAMEEYAKELWTSGADNEIYTSAWLCRCQVGIAYFYLVFIISRKQHTRWVAEMNEFFGELCTDGDYIDPALLKIGQEVEVPEISE